MSDVFQVTLTLLAIGTLLAVIAYIHDDDEPGGYANA